MAREREDESSPHGCDSVGQTLQAATGLEDLWARLEATREHWQRCPHCRARFASLARALLSASDEITCAECQAHWPALVDARLAGKRAPGRLRLADAHLALCGVCGDAFAALLQTLRQEEQGALEEPPTYPRFDLSFLAGRPLWAPAPTPPDPTRQVRQLVAGAALCVRVLRSPLQASFASLAAGLRPVPVALPATRRGPGAQGQRLSLPDPAANVTIALTVQAAGQGRSHLSVEVRELEPDRPLPGARASLASRSGQEMVPLREGRATFAGLDPAHYVLEVAAPSPEGPERLWVLPISVEAA